MDFQSSVGQIAELETLIEGTINTKKKGYASHSSIFISHFIIIIIIPNSHRTVDFELIPRCCVDVKGQGGNVTELLG